jgi:hypothetical protein
MKQRGRKGQKAGGGGDNVVTGVFGERPAPPGDLTPEQAAEWRAIVDRMPVSLPLRRGRCWPSCAGTSRGRGC